MRKLMTVTPLAAAILLVVPQAARAVPEFAKQWESSCASCHVGAPTSLDEEGVAFKLAGYEQEIDAKNPRPKLFLSLVTDLVSFSDGDSMAAPESAQLFSMLRADRAGKVKLFLIGELADEPNGELGLDFAHGHVQANPLADPEKLGLRAGNIEPITRLWNSDMRRLFESSLWGGVDTATGAVAAGAGGGHAHGHGGSGNRPGVLPASDWGADVSSVLRRDLMVAGGFAGDDLFAGVFFKRGGRGFDNSTLPPGLDYAALSSEEQSRLNQQQTKLAKKWERSVIFGLSAYVGDGDRDVFDGSFLPAASRFAEHGGDDHGDEGDDHGDEGDDHGDEGDDHGDEGDDHGDEGDDHGDEGDDHGDGGDDHGDGGHEETFLPTRMRGTSRLVGEINTRWDRFGLYLVGVYGTSDYRIGDADRWQDEGVFESVGDDSQNFFAWALETSARFRVDRIRTGRVAVRYERLSPENDAARAYQRAVANLTIPVRIMRPAIWPYLEASRDLELDNWDVRGGLRIGY